MPFHFPLTGRRPLRLAMTERTVTAREGRTLRVRSSPNPQPSASAVSHEDRFWAGFLAAMQAPDQAGFERRMRETVRDFEQAEQASRSALRVVRDHHGTED